jgi:hypothetical protein
MLYSRCKNTMDPSVIPIFLGQAPLAVGGRESCVHTHVCVLFRKSLQAASSPHTPILQGPSLMTTSLCSENNKKSYNKQIIRKQRRYKGPKCASGFCHASRCL